MAERLGDPTISILRTLAGALFGLLGLSLLVVSATAPFLLGEEVEENRFIRDAFERTATHLAGQTVAPSRTELSQWTGSQGTEWFWSAIHVDQGSCAQDGFARAEGDNLVLLLWRGEHFDCFASPSGRTTLETSTEEVLLGSRGLGLAAGFLAGCFFIWLAMRALFQGHGGLSSPPPMEN